MFRKTLQINNMEKDFEYYMEISIKQNIELAKKYAPESELAKQSEPPVYHEALKHIKGVLECLQIGLDNGVPDDDTRIEFNKTYDKLQDLLKKSNWFNPSILLNKNK